MHDNVDIMHCRFARIRSERLQKSVVRITGKTTGLLGGVVMSVEGNKKSEDGNKNSVESNKKRVEGSKKSRGKRSRVEEDQS